MLLCTPTVLARWQVQSVVVCLTIAQAALGKPTTMPKWALYTVFILNGLGGTSKRVRRWQTSWSWSWSCSGTDQMVCWQRQCLCVGLAAPNSFACGAAYEHAPSVALLCLPPPHTLSLPLSLYASITDPLGTHMCTRLPAAPCMQW